MRLSKVRRRRLLRKAFNQIPATGLRQMLKTARLNPRKVLLDGRISRQGGAMCPMALCLPGVEAADWISVLSIDPGWRNFDWDPVDGLYSFQDALTGSTLAQVVEVAKEVLRLKVALQWARRS